ncbi:ribosomal protein L22 [Hesseltinella vesiculosa]|uniref:Ribosomal protein L22 n=1 Tax=Hesseltinella vesiculosa TaxID=101127 RepID=A0A1X2GQZ3_9FUNG|nr:ribosomal protein L22 [Hesseltinella vesiculosa]
MLSLTQAFKGLKPFQTVNLSRPAIAKFSSTSKTFADQPARPQVGGSSLFDNVQKEAEATISENSEPVKKEYRWSTANFKGSHRKLNMIARQLRNLTVDEAIRQMEFSPKRASSKILHNLAFARKNAADQHGMKDLIVSQAWVGKGRYHRRVNPHGRGQFGIMHRKEAHMKFILTEKPAQPEPTQGSRRNIRGWKETKKVWTPLNETKPVYNPKPYYNW